MRRMLQSAGIRFEEIPDVQQVLIKTASKEIMIEKPSVNIFDVKGKKVFQIFGEVTEKALEIPFIPEEDVHLVAQQARVSLEEARKALEQAKGNLAEAIIGLRSKKGS